MSQGTPNARKVGKSPWHGERSHSWQWSTSERWALVWENGENPFPPLPGVAPTAGNTRPVKSLGDKILLFPSSPGKEIGGAEPGRFLRWFWVNKKKKRNSKLIGKWFPASAAPVRWGIGLSWRQSSSRKGLLLWSGQRQGSLSSCHGQGQVQGRATTPCPPPKIPGFVSSPRALTRSRTQARSGREAAALPVPARQPRERWGFTSPFPFSAFLLPQRAPRVGTDVSARCTRPRAQPRPAPSPERQGSVHRERACTECAHGARAWGEHARREHAQTQRACVERACAARAHLLAALAKVQTLPPQGEIRGLPLRRPQPSHLSGGFACHTSGEATLIPSHAKDTYARTGVGGEYDYTCSAAPDQLHGAFSCGTATQSPGGAGRDAGAV